MKNKLEEKTIDIINKIELSKYKYSTRQAAKDIKQVFLEYFMGVIGEDEHTKPVRGIEEAFNQMGDALLKSTRNKLRSKLREQIKEDLR